MMLTGPILATEKLLKKSGVSVDEIGVFEVNEAFAPVPLAWQAELGVPLDKLNPLGGAIAVGHPLGASGAILMTRMINHMRSPGCGTGCRRCVRVAAPPTRHCWNWRTDRWSSTGGACSPRSRRTSGC
jgi:acetyl-CoA acetyltransferase